MNYLSVVLKHQALLDIKKLSLLSLGIEKLLDAQHLNTSTGADTEGRYRRKSHCLLTIPAILVAETVQGQRRLLAGFAVRVVDRAELDVGGGQRISLWRGCFNRGHGNARAAA